MNYKKIYDSLINRSLYRKISVPYENHHIRPKCIGGLDIDSNLTKLTLREHYIAHLLLTKMYKSSNRKNLVFAFRCFCNHKKINSRLYKLYRLEANRIMKNGRLWKKKVSTTMKHKRAIWITKNSIDKRVSVEEVDEYLLSGWKRGRTIKYRAKHSELTKKRIKRSSKTKVVSKETRLKTSESMKNFVWINKQNKSKFIDKNNIDNYVDKGWKRGRGKIKGKYKNFIWINKEGRRTRIKKTSKDKYLELGWSVGQGLKRTLSDHQIKSFGGSTRNSIWIKKLKKQKRISKDYLDKYLISGWKLGRVKTKRLGGNQYAKK